MADLLNALDDGKAQTSNPDMLYHNSQDRHWFHDSF